MPEQIGRYTVVEELRRGGMARTVLCRAPDQRLVVVKQPLERDEALAKRLRDEFRVGRRVRHPHLVETLDLIDVGDHVGAQAIVVSYFKGVPLGDLRGLAVPPAAVARIGAQIASALAALHGTSDDDGRSLGIVHRDLSSGNILVGATGDACLIDLGIARWDEVRSAHTETGALIGTVRYFAPELLEDKGYSPASDVWALGCCLVELVRGSPLFSGRTQDVLLAVARYRSPVDVEGLDVETPLGAVVAAMLARDPASRPDAATVAARLAEVETALGGGRADLADLASGVIASSRARRTASPPAPSSSASGTSPTAATVAGRPPTPATAPPLRAAIVGGMVSALAIGAAVFVFIRAPQAPEVAPPAPVTLTPSSSPPPVLPPPEPSPPPSPPPDVVVPVAPALPPPPVVTPTAEPLPPLPPGLAEALRAPRGRKSDALDAVRGLVLDGDPHMALRALQAIEPHAPDDPRLHRSYGIVYDRLGEKERSRAAFARFLALAPDHPDAARIRHRHGL